MKDEDNSKRIFLTFDDGPNEPYTSQILDVLKKFQATASFFVCGENVEYYPSVAKRIVREGHVIGSHSYSHSRLLTYMGLLSEEIEKTQRVIQKITGIETFFFRPPWGISTPWIKRYLKDHGFKLILWDIDSPDWKKSSVSDIIQNVMGKSKPNSVVLFHDGKKTNHQSDRSDTLNALPHIIEKLRADGYVFEGVGGHNTF